MNNVEESLESANKVRVAAIIPSLYEVDKDYLQLTVESLRATTDWDIIVVTNGTKYKPNLEHIYGITAHLHIPHQGQCAAVNAGAYAVASGVEYLFISNSDMYYAPEWNKNLRFDWQVFSPNLIEPVNNAGSAAPFLKVDGGFTIDEFDKAVVDKEVYDATINGPVEPEKGFNFPVFIKKQLWQEIGGYDEAYDPWGSNSDTDLQTRINIAGVTPVRARDVLVYHFSNKSGTFDGTHQDFYMNNIEYFKSKFGFDRDELGSDVWYNEKILPIESEQIKYKPSWAGKYSENTNDR